MLSETDSEGSLLGLEGQMKSGRIAQTEVGQQIFWSKREIWKAVELLFQIKQLEF